MLSVYVLLLAGTCPMFTAQSTKLTVFSDQPLEVAYGPFSASILSEI